jgi:MFS family permease
MFFFIPDLWIMASVMPEIQSTYPDVSQTNITWLVSLPSAFETLCALIVGYVLGRKISFRALSIVACVAFTVLGGIPALVPMGYGALLVFRIVFGFSLGCFQPICQAYITKLYPEEKSRARILGFAFAIFNVGILVGTWMGGIMGTYFQWRYVFAFYFGGIIPLVLVTLFMKEPPGEAELKKEKIRFPASGWAMIILYLLAMVVTNGWHMFISFVVADLGGSPLLSSHVLNTFAVCCIIIALVFAWLYRLAGHHVLAIAAAILILSNLSSMFGGLFDSIPWLFAAGAFQGLATNLFTVAMTFELGVLMPKAAVAAAMGWIAVTGNLGTTVATPLLGFFAAINGANAPSYMIFLDMTIISVGILVFGIIMGRILNRKAAESEKLPDAPAL